MRSVVLGFIFCLGLGTVSQAQLVEAQYHQGHGGRVERRRDDDRWRRQAPAPRYDHRRDFPRYEPRPGWYAGWRWDWRVTPPWWRVGIVLPWVWIGGPAGYWQCTAYNQYQQPFSAAAPAADQAAYDALYECGGPNYLAFGCYVPQGYCRVIY